MVRAEAVSKMQKIKDLYFHPTMISYFLICKLFPEVSSGTDRLNLMTIKVMKREQIDVLKAQICSQFAKSNVGEKNKKKPFINGVSCWSVKHIFLRWQNKEKWHLYICVSQFPTLVKKKNAGTEELKTSYLRNTNEEICNSD